MITHQNVGRSVGCFISSAVPRFRLTFRLFCMTENNDANQSQNGERAEFREPGSPASESPQFAHHEDRGEDRGLREDPVWLR